MDKRFAIFDMDGTLVDSMVFWRNLAGEYLARQGVGQVPPEIIEAIRPMTMSQSAALFQKEFGLKDSPEQICAQMNAMMEEHYRRDIPLKPGTAQYLRALHKRGVRMCVASATDEELMRACLARLGVAEYFAFLLSCEQVGAGKDRPDVYLEAARRLGAPPKEIAVYEDALYAAQTARAAGFWIVGVYEECTREKWPAVQAVSDEYIQDWREQK